MSDIETQSADAAAGRRAAGPIDPAVDAFEIPARESAVPPIDEAVESASETATAVGTGDRANDAKRAGHRRRHSRHGRRRHGSAPRKRSDLRAVRPRGRRWYLRVAMQLASMVLLAVAVYAMCIDSGLRKPGTEDTPGDPPTHFFYASLLAGACSMTFFVGSLRRRKQRRRSFGLLAGARPAQNAPGSASVPADGSGLRAVREKIRNAGRARQAAAPSNGPEGDPVKRLLEEHWHELSPEARRLIGTIAQNSLASASDPTRQP